VSLSVVIPVQDEEKTLGPLLKEVQKLNPLEIIVVVNGSNDRSKEIASSYGAKVLHYQQALGNDVGRAIGFKQASGDIILFLDGDIIISYKELLPFIEAIQAGFDIALNDLSFLVKQRKFPHYTTVCKLAVNNYLKKNDLSLNSMLAVPHAIKRKAIKKIGWTNLADPILIQAMAVKYSLRICAPASVDVIHTNRIRPVHSELDPNSCYPITTSRIIGDHLRAVSYVINKFGVHGGLFHKNQNRKVAYKLITNPLNLKKKGKYCAIIDHSNENQLLFPIIEQVKLAGVDEIILVVNKENKDLIAEAEAIGTAVIVIHENFSPQAARVVGAYHSSADICLFVSSEELYLAKDIKPFLQTIEKGIDIALTDRKNLLDSFDPKDSISIGQYFVNMAVNRPDLFNNSLNSTPYAIHKNVFKTIGYESFISPSYAQLKAIIKGFSIQALSPSEMKPFSQRPGNINQVLGDQVEALAYLLDITNERGGFTDGVRMREFLQ
jgi:glycosyltransferase involved in cell wall biosynthesis